MKVKRTVSGSLSTNGYLIYDECTMKGYLIDPDGVADIFINQIGAISVNLEGIILTHGHYDHRGAVEKIKNKYQCNVLIHKEEKNNVPLDIDIYLKDNDEIKIGNQKLKVINTPGHTKGSLCLVSEDGKIVFTGDTIFNVDLGRTDLASGSPNDMIKTIKNIVSHWPDDTIIYPGHGDPCSMAFVRKNNWEYNEIIK